MNEKNKEVLGKEIHDRVLKSIGRDKRKSNIKNLSIISVVLAVVCFGAFVLMYKDQLFNSLQNESKREFTADFLAGTYTQKNDSDSKTEQLAIGKDKSEAIYHDKSQNKTILNVSKLHLDDDDVLNIKTGIGGFYKVELPDGSIVNLNANSNLHYAANYLKDRKLTLAGEAYFEVKKMIVDDKRAPFEVKTNQQIIKVLGTAFNVKTTVEFDETLLNEGSLEVKAVNTGNTNILKPGDLIHVAKSNYNIEKLQEGEIEERLAWKEGFLYYDNRTLSYILSDLQKYYDFKFDKNLVPKESFTIYLARENSLRELISLLDSSSFAGLNLNNNTLTFNK